MIPDTHRKRSFRRFSCPIPLDAIRAEFEALPAEAWDASYWGDIHCSIGMLLLRGGNRGAQEDFYCDEVFDQPVLEDLPAISRLISDDGPFGRAKYAFLFKMRPGGVTLVHRDTIDRWHDMYRIHVPIRTNDGAFLISDNRSQHLAAGHAWSFDNQTRHGVVNGDEERAHLIFDVDWNDALQDQVERSEVVPGRYVEEHVERIHARSNAVPSYFGDPMIRTGAQRLRSRGLTDEQIVEYFNAKRVPTRKLHHAAWDVDTLREIVDADVDTDVDADAAGAD